MMLRASSFATTLALASACMNAEEPKPRHAVTERPQLNATQSSEPTAKSASPVVTFIGMCDASGAVPLSNHVFVVADDEDNVLRAYDADRGGAPLWQRDASQDLALPQKRAKKNPAKVKKNPAKVKKAPETDIEAATRLGDLAFWLTSHGRNSSGKLKPERFRFFATTAPEDGSALRVVDNAPTNLLDAFLADQRYAAFGLAEASRLAPKAEGGLNIEGMTAGEEGGVWIGFRNPNPNGKALVAVLTNPVEVVNGASAKLGPPILLELGGLGVSSLSSWRGTYLIAAASYDGSAAPKLFSWDGRSQPRALPYDGSAGVNPEGFFTPEDREEIMLLSDDGTVPIEGVDCKKLKDPTQKRFRGVWMSTRSFSEQTKAGS